MCVALFYVFCKDSSSFAPRCALLSVFVFVLLLPLIVILKHHYPLIKWCARAHRQQHLGAQFASYVFVRCYLSAFSSARGIFRLLGNSPKNHNDICLSRCLNCPPYFRFLRLFLPKYIEYRCVWVSVFVRMCIYIIFFSSHPLLRLNCF